jgi:spermidine synthase
MALMSSPLVLVALFAGSGMAALIYEVVWQQLLQLVIGSSTLSLGVLLATFMGGMCLGSLAAPRVFSNQRDPLRTYALLEAAIGVMGLALLFAMPLVQRVYIFGGGSGVAGTLWRAGVAAVCLLPPTFAMGATLPVIARWIDRDARGHAWLALFYAGNLGGAVAGCLLAGFVLLPWFNMAVATYVAAAVNGTVALTAWRAARTSRPGAHREDTGAARLTVDAGDRSPFQAGSRHVFIVIALSGFCALASEVVWTRLLALVFGATVYTFSIVLAVFLVGLGIGSGAGAALVRRSTRALGALGWCQLAVVAAVAWSAFAIQQLLPYWTRDAGTTEMWAVFRFDLLRSAIALLPAPILWGASFSLALAAAAEDDPDQGRAAGRVYAANTFGAIVGALAASAALIPSIGSQHTQQLILLAAAVAAVMATLAGRHASGKLAAAVATAIVAVAAAAVVPPLPGVLVGYGRHAAAWTAFADKIVYVGEGMHATVAVSRNDDGVLNYHNAGKVQASSQPADMRLQRMLGHLTTLLPDRPRKVLVIGCGAGVTAGAVSVNPAVDEVVIVDIEPLVPQVAREYFGTVNHEVLKNPKVRVVADDARHFLQTTSETFDAITSDPLDPWVKGAATLYTREFFDTARRHLTPGGVMTLYVQLFESSTAAVKSEVGTFFSAFPDGLVFANIFEGHAIDMVLVGPRQRPLAIDVDEVESRLRSPAYATMDSSLMQAGLYGAADLFANYAGRARDLGGWLADAAITHDLDLRLQYLAGLGLNQHSGDEIYREMVAYRVFPDDLFVGADRTLGELKALMAGTRE